MTAPGPFLAALRCTLALLPLAGAACSGGDNTKVDQDVAVRATATLAAVIAREPQISETARLLSRTGLAEVLDGAGSYTMLTPTDEAFEDSQLQYANDGQSSGSRRTMALLQHHILPGYITIGDIENAMDREAGGVALMRTLDGGFVRFARSGGAITAIDQTGMRARLSGEQIFAANGVALTLD